MPIAAVRATVSDFVGFREAHDRFIDRLGDRLRSALLKHNLYQSAEDPQQILIVDYWINIEAAQSMYASTGFRDAEMNAFVLDVPEWHWYIQTEARTIE